MPVYQRPNTLTRAWATALLFIGVCHCMSDDDGRSPKDAGAVAQPAPDAGESRAMLDASVARDAAAMDGSAGASGGGGKATGGASGGNARAGSSGAATAGTSGARAQAGAPGTAGSGGSTGNSQQSPPKPLLEFHMMYSAYDGVHTYQLTPRVPRASLDRADSDFIAASDLHWSVDTDFVTLEAYDALPGAVLLTTKKAGQTGIRVSVTLADGTELDERAQLQISSATDAEWQAGQMRYTHGMKVSWATLEQPSNPGLSCALPADTIAALPKDSDCASCHMTASPLRVPVFTPTQTAGFSNDQLIAIFCMRYLPADAMFITPFMKNTTPANATCLYRSFHTWQLTDEVMIGIVWVLRSLQPMPLMH
jgi:hypothetical protein